MTTATQLPLTDQGRDAWEYAPIDRAAFRFFREHAGYVVGRRALCAAQLARAEAEGERRGWSVVWADDDYADLGDHELWCDGYAADLKRKASPYANACGKFDSLPSCPGHYAEWAGVRDADGAPTPLGASLGGILDATPEYRRVIEAELMLEALRP